MKIKTIILSIAVGIFAVLSAHALAAESEEEDWESEVFNVLYTIRNNSDDRVLRVEFNNWGGKKEVEDVKSNSTRTGTIKWFTGHASYEVFLVNPSNGKKLLLAASGLGPTPFNGEMVGVGSGLTLKKLNLTYSLENQYDKNNKIAEFEFILDSTNKKEEL